MQRALYIQLLLLLSALSSLAQDQLFKTDNTRLLVKILEVGPEEIKYKLFDNLNGPVYIENRQNVSVIIYQSGEHQVITPGTALPAGEGAQREPKRVVVPFIEMYDSASYFRQSNSISINFLNFFNNEVGICYRREFFKKQFNIIFPFAIGVSKPWVTQNFYFNTAPVKVTLTNKTFEVGFGIHYYPSLKNKTNYYIGPVARYMQYKCTQEAFVNSWPSYLISANSTTLSRYAFSITNGLISRTRSRLTTNLFLSIGFKSDQVKDPLRDNQGTVIQTVRSPMSLFWWSGFEVGFSF